MAKQPNLGTGGAESAFEAIRRRTRQQGSRNKQQTSDTLRRRFAALGGGPSGAAIKAEQRALREVERGTQDQLAGINLAEQQQREQLAEAQRGREFAREERLGSQEFSAGQTEKQQAFSKELFDKDLAFKKLVQNQNFSLAERDLQESIRANNLNFVQALGNLDFATEDIQNILGQANLFLPEGNQFITPPPPPAPAPRRVVNPTGGILI